MSEDEKSERLKRLWDLAPMFVEGYAPCQISRHAICGY